MKYSIYIENRMIAEAEGTEFAWEIYRKACELADLLDEIAVLVDNETGEVIESSDDWDDYDENYEPEDIDSDMGFDPYLGCFSDDC